MRLPVARLGENLGRVGLLACQALARVVALEIVGLFACDLLKTPILARSRSLLVAPALEPVTGGRPLRQLVVTLDEDSGQRHQRVGDLLLAFESTGQLQGGRGRARRARGG